GMSQVSEDEDTELDDIEQFEKNIKINSVNEWQETVNNRDSLVIEDEKVIVELDDSDEELIEHSFEDKHPAVASKAKWKLETLFDKDYLEPPKFVNLLK
ncbi:20564_t:CDS:1, partial [Gigaspora rosea]